MKRKELIKGLKKCKADEVLICVDGLYMPIVDVIMTEEYTIIKVKNVETRR